MNPREALALALLVVALLGPFVGKAYHVDDLYTLAGIENVLRDPLDPIGGSVGWVPIPRLLRQFELNPPLLVYLLAPVAALSGFSETALHVALLPFGLVLAGNFDGCTYVHRLLGIRPLSCCCSRIHQ